MSSIDSYFVSPLINNRAGYSACGVGSIDELGAFKVSSYTSGAPRLVGHTVQATLTPPLSTALPEDIQSVALWVDALTTANCGFTVDSAQALVLRSGTDDLRIASASTDFQGNAVSNLARITNDVAVPLVLTGNLSILPENTTSDTLELIATNSSLTVIDNQNGPFGDPIYTRINANFLSMQAGDGGHITSSMTSSTIDIINEEGALDYFNASAHGVTLRDDAAPKQLSITASSITATTLELVSEGDFVLTGVDMQSDSAGDESGVYLRILLNGVYRKILLLNDE